VVEPHAVGEKWLSLRPPGDRLKQAVVVVPGTVDGGRDFVRLRCGSATELIMA